MCLAGYTVKVAFYAFSTMLAHVSAYTILEGLRRQVAHKLMHAPLGLSLIHIYAGGGLRLFYAEQFG